MFALQRLVSRTDFGLSGHGFGIQYPAVQCFLTVSLLSLAL